VADVEALEDVDVVTDLPEEDVVVVNSNAVMVKDAAKVVERAVDVEAEEESVAVDPALPVVQVVHKHQEALLSTPTIRALSQAWDHRISNQKTPHGGHRTTACLHNTCSQANDGAKVTLYAGVRNMLVVDSLKMKMEQLPKLYGGTAFSLAILRI
jgi:hypothetical protein